ncbi:prepilin-type N-terminal cleavage/methylation domain-containing protein [Ligilactobacillus saerimneri]|uniref:prepilin-type N-terminal cleavage/methylation domain-containing protein n=1 Tax=Ligilactobacillus saerimneri TaxID=228229 RepID=UPI0030CBE8BD
MKKYLAKKVPAFTLLEMVVVLFIISLLVLIILPNVAAQRKNASKINRNALQTELNTQAQLYMNDHNVNSVTVADLEQAKYLTASQVEAIKREHLEISHEK